MGIFLIIVIGVIIYFYNFNQANNQDIAKIQAQGGIENKFFILFQFIESTSPLIRILERTNRYVTWGYTQQGMMVRFFVQHSFNKVHIRWNCDSPYFGKFAENWEFPEHYDQHKMGEEIDLKISNILRQAMGHL